MVEPMRTLTDRDEDDGDYQPVNMLAVAAVSMAGLFLALAVILTAVGLYTRKPVLVTWLIAIAVIGVLLAVAARWTIRLSEGTRVGLGLANVAWWMCVVGGCVYGAYYAGSVISIHRQARGFVQDVWLQSLKDGNADAAYYFTVKPQQRKGMDISEIRRNYGDVVAPFKRNWLVRVLLRAEGKVQIEPKGAVHWNETIEGKEVSTQFLIRTPEGEFDVLIEAIGADFADLEGRQWVINPEKIGVRVVGLTTLGQNIAALETDSAAFLGEWARDKMGPFRRDELWLDTQPLTRDERKQKHREYVTRSTIGTWLDSIVEPARGLTTAATLSAHLNMIRSNSVIDFPESATIAEKLIVWDESRKKYPDADKKKMLPLMLGNGVIEMVQSVGSTAGNAPQIEISEAGIRATLHLSVTLPIKRERCRGYATAICRDLKLAKHLSDLKKADWSGVPKLEPAAQRARLEWQIVELKVDLARDLTDERPGGGSSPIGPGPGGMMPDGMMQGGQRPME